MLIVMIRIVGIAMAVIVVLCAVNIVMRNRLLGPYSKIVSLFGLGCLVVFIVLQVIGALAGR
ncbi:hypothetical protein CUZ56_01773 [Saezia sanguinis]|uniref:Uncharacterized protein n=1 Tax=Saezia sanguinis TaxID=1965230 RepID=A0A433SCM0_9BURK|nr:hypothetical protein [Saezia sanguinis]RUS66493.1 hypothetical protein CUZ56_01773 [Saezia sanguinis]